MEIVRAHISADMDFAPDDAIETEFAWLFFPNSKQYIRTRDRREMLFGSSKCLIQKADERVHWFNTMWSAEDSLRICELGYLKYQTWGIEVTGVQDETAAVEYLSRLELESVVREGAHGVFVTTRTRLSSENLSQILKNLPVRFFLGEAWIKWKVLESFKSQAAFAYRLSEHDWNAECV